MQIANPIYDVVFKYLMADERAAKLIIGEIISMDVIDIALQPQERLANLTEKNLTVYRLDFSARVKTRDGQFKQVIIEIQKAKYTSDIMRFRRYLGQQYSDEKNVHATVSATGHSTYQALPIITIYFLGHTLNHCTASVIKVGRIYTDAITGETLADKETFIESLTHDSYVVQIPYLKAQRRNDLEKLLEIFDQDLQVENRHRLSIDEALFPKKYHVLIRRLQAAISEPEVIDTMQIEDEILLELQNKEREIEAKEQLVEEQSKALKEKNRVLEEKDQALEKKDQALEEKDQIVREQEQALEEKDQVLKDKDKLIKELKNQLNRLSE